MNRIFYAALLVAAAITITSCATTVMELKPTGPEEKRVYKLTTLGFSRDIRDGAIKSAGEFCGKQNKYFKFVKNIYLPQSVAGLDMVSLDLFFFCLDEQPAEPIPTETDAGEDKKIMQPESVPEQNTPEAEAEPAPPKKTRIEITGDSPGEEEPLGDQAGGADVDAVHAKQGDAIIEEILEK